MLTPRWGDDHDAIRAHWLLDPAVTFLNHGSFGATPRPVLAAQSALRDEMESQPVRFLDRELRPRLADVRAELADLLDADPAGLAFVPNATTGVASVLASIPLAPGDEVVITDHAYNAVRLAAARACDRVGARLVIAPLAPSGVSAGEDVARALTTRTRLAIIDHVVSWNGLVLDAEAIVAVCRARSVPIMIDGAHAPGMIDVSIRRLDPDLWVGNLHKWVCAPKGAGALWVAPHLRSMIHPPMTSHGAGQGLLDEFDWMGTNDPTAVLSIPAALRFLREIGVERMRAYNTDLARYAREIIAAALGTEPPWPATRQAFMVGIPLGIDLPDKPAAQRFHAFAYERTATEMPVMAWVGQTVLRASAQVYNSPAEYERFAAAIPTVRDAYRASMEQRTS